VTRALLLRALVLTATLASEVVGCGGSHGVSQPSSEAGPDVTYVLPPVIDASFGDSAQTRDRIQFPCGTVTGAITADLVCDRLFPDLNWDFEPHYAFVSIAATIASGAKGPDAAVSALAMQGLVFNILTPPPTAPMTESCATVPPLPPNVWGPAFEGGGGNWMGACDSATEVLPGSSFDLTITSVGVLTSDSLGADPLDAGADGFDWDAAHQEILTNTFHGTFKATLVAGDAGPPLYVSMTF
jgi:hypothetical protein